MGWNVGDVRHPDFLRPIYIHLIWPILEQVWMLMEAVMAIRRLVIRTPSRHKQTRLPQHVKQTISTQFDSSV